ncbi:hypothetical protein ACFFOM_15465 [Microlunatus capsulatus]|uniref:Drug/metabolite transporter (DMT)-like permease n=1 Tax=Microlunatus capsulatus TaxID=99117 RepID=A0ABS4Z732_9ACTN|nr:hypothetical protein [Microlunatus capsulatus]MBP2416853.1 drug/metabolite transporter (DMT)-like permease [Microlunatus capsulatus]
MSRARSTAGRVAATVATLLVVAAGVAGVVAGERDDSPGLQALGALLVLAAVVLHVRARRHRRPTPPRA